MNPLYVFIFSYVLCSFALFIAMWEPKRGSTEIIASALVGITWPFWVLVRFFLILKMNP
jgi:hypothetical protein